MAKRILMTYLVLTWLGSMLVTLHAPIYVMFLLQTLNYWQVGLVNTVFMVGVVLWEIPTGAVADRWGRKLSYVLSHVVVGGGFLIYYCAGDWLGYMLAEAVIAIGVTLASGSFRAWVVDSLAAHGWTGQLSYLFRWEGRVMKTASIVGGLMGAWLGARDLSLPFIVSGIGFIILAIFSWLAIVEDRLVIVDDATQQLSWRQLMVHGIGISWQRPVVKIIVLVSFVFGLAFQPLNMYWQPWFQAHQLTTQDFGLIWTGIVIFSLAGNELVDWFSRLHSQHSRVYSYLSVFIGVVIIFTVAAGHWYWTLVWFLIHEIGRGMIQPLQNSWLQAELTSQTRATVDSFVSMIGKAGAAIGLVGFGWLTEFAGIGWSWSLAAVLLIIILPTLLWLWQQNQQKPSL
ncbi:MAG: MFS transporter [Candidatus Komeilibacteria bacterium]